MEPEFCMHHFRDENSTILNCYCKVHKLKYSCDFNNDTKRKCPMFESCSYFEPILKPSLKD